MHKSIKCMKAKLLFFLAILLFPVSGCVKSMPIEENDSSLTESMHNYFKVDYVYEIKGEHFQAKLLSLAKVYYEDTIIYKYSFVVAPLLDEKMDIYSFTLSLNDEAKNYYQQCGFTKYDMYMIKMFEKGDIPKASGKQDMHAYRFEVLIDNVNNETQMKHAISDEQFDEIVSELFITIDFNYKSETLRLFSDNLLVIKIEDDIPEGRIDLLSYLKTGTFKEPLFATFIDSNWDY